MNTILAPSALHKIPNDINDALGSNQLLVNIWNKLTPIQRNEWICWVSMVKQQKTREEHLIRMVEDLQNGKKSPCCWQGCPHRNPKNAKWFKDLDHYDVP